VLIADLLLRRWPEALAGELPAAARPLAVLGTWSLSFYMLHQPVLIGAIRLYRWATTGQF
jgi:peptidoglycan/LPS O-acetylase OafA/YrhL